jgi:crotonobetainyl-CoA:carnitine CoA-transferase CaiB-like acyl-CoA transferase
MSVGLHDRADRALEASPLSGLFVLEWGQRVGASVCGSLLAQLGAEVIFVESGTAGSGAGIKLTWRPAMAAGKRSLLLREDSAEERVLVEQLARRADIVLRSSDLDSGCRFLLPDLAEHQIDCDVTAFGHGGSAAGGGWSEPLIQAVSGVMYATGLPDGPPVAIDFPLVEFMTGAYAAAAVLAALRVRRRTALGQAIDMALFDCAFYAMSTFLPQVLTGGTAARRVGNRHSMASPWNVYRACDGWVLICAASDVQWQRMCEVMGRRDLVSDPRFATLSDRVANNEDVDAAVQAWVGETTTGDCIVRLGAASIACGPIAEIDGYPRERNIEYRAMARLLRDPEAGAPVYIPASPLRMSRTPGVGPRAIPAIDSGRRWVTAELQRTPVGHFKGEGACDALPLAGVRVIELGHYTTAPLAARHLANLGADVVKIEPPGGEAVRVWPPTKHGQGVFFTYTNVDKKSLVLDLATDEDVVILRRLVASADVLIENLKPGTLAKRGFTSEALLNLNPRLIYCAVSGFGADSLYAGRPAFDTVIQAMSGVMDLIRTDGMPLKSGPSSADIMGAELAVVSILAALEHRDRTGEGQSIDLSMQDIAAWLTQTRWNSVAAGPQGVLLECSDGLLYVEGGAAPQPMLANAPPSATRAERQAALAATGVRAAPVNSVSELAAHPLVQKRRLWFEFHGPDGEAWPLLGSPLRLSSTPPQVRRPMGRLDQDREEVLREWLGLSASRNH